VGLSEKSGPRGRTLPRRKEARLETVDLSRAGRPKKVRSFVKKTLVMEKKASARDPGGREVFDSEPSRKTFCAKRKLGNDLS